MNINEIVNLIIKMQKETNKNINIEGLLYTLLAINYDDYDNKDLFIEDDIQTIEDKIKEFNEILSIIYKKEVKQNRSDIQYIFTSLILNDNYKKSYETGVNNYKNIVKSILNKDYIQLLKDIMEYQQKLYLELRHEPKIITKINVLTYNNITNVCDKVFYSKKINDYINSIKKNYETSENITKIKHLNGEKSIKELAQEIEYNLTNTKKYCLNLKGII